ncbi:sensor domain-containing protein [Geothrix sp. 21YS21S-4]|uniref:sensor domain-containing protein n=1 Tax=Geothrix sp. 21YS21S-4 TaxID=3068889 RepID=UPI0027B8D2D7|nr:sensor domain-containing protein [Geothrix sp. 21YS21S-4]
MSSPSHPGFFEVLAVRRAYTTLLYLLLSLGTGILAFTFAVTGLSLSLGLAILIVGLPVALLFLLGTRLLSVAELHLLRLLVDDGMEAAPIPDPLPPGTGFLARTKALAADRRTWTSLLYFLLHLPLGIAYFTAFATLLSVGLSLIAAPFAPLFGATASLDLGAPAWLAAHPGSAGVLCALAGLALLPLTFHLALALGRFQTWLARHLLVRA